MMCRASAPEQRNSRYHQCYAAARPVRQSLPRADYPAKRVFELAPIYGLRRICGAITLASAGLGNALLATLKNGAWLTRGRVRAYCRLLLLMQVVAVLALLITSNGRVDMIGRPLGTDFISFYTAGKIVRTSPPADVYRPDAHYSAEQHIAGREDIPYYAYYYPPVFLPICWALSFLPYLAALLVWLGATGAAFVIAARSIAGPRETLLPILAYPACFLNVGHGQNGFLTAALFATATMQLDKRPWLAGALFGALCYKPQLALLVPVALLFGGCWRAFVAAALAAAALVGLSVAAFGVETWAAYVAVVPQVQSIFEAGGVGFEKMGSTFSALRLLGGTVEAARLAPGRGNPARRRYNGLYLASRRE